MSKDQDSKISSCDTIQESHGRIYCAINSLNEKKYIGKVEFPKTIKERWKEHENEGKLLTKMREENPNKRIYGTHLNNAIAKYRLCIWKVKKIDIAFSKDELDIKETYWIKFYKSYDRRYGYNLTFGGTGGKQTEEVIQKISESMKKRWKDPKYQNNFYKGIAKFNRSKNYREKMSELVKQRWQDENYREKMSIACKNNWTDLKYREKVIGGVKESFLNPVIKKKHSESLKKSWENPQRRQQHSKTLSKVITKKWQDPKYRKKQFISKSNVWKKKWEDPKFRENYSKIRKKKILDIKQFLLDIKNGAKQEDIARIYKIKSHHTQNRIIKELLEQFNINTLKQARIFLKDKDINELLKDLS